MRTYRQDSDDTKAYFFDWSEQLEKDAIGTRTGEPSISTSAWSVTGMTAANATINGSVTRVELSGGSVDTSYKVENKITTSKGLVHTKSFYVLVVNK